MLSNAKKSFTMKQALECLRNVRQDVVADEELAKAALDIVNNYYWASVRGTAADFLKRAQEGEFKDDESLRDALHEDIDGNYWVIYTYWARVCLLCSSNTYAFEEEMGDEAKPENVSQQAYFAMMADISNQPDMEEAFALARGEDEA